MRNMIIGFVVGVILSFGYAHAAIFSVGGGRGSGGGVRMLRAEGSGARIQQVLNHLVKQQNALLGLQNVSLNLLRATSTFLVKKCQRLQ